jgi:chromosome segregation ATPase
MDFPRLFDIFTPRRLFRMLPSRPSKSSSQKGSVHSPNLLPRSTVPTDQSDLRQQLQQLTEERDRLKAQLQKRAELQSKRPPRVLAVSPQFTSPSDREYATLSQQVLELRAQLAQIMQSDNAFRREELQEEAKVLYQEWKRLQDVTFQQQIAVSDAQKELDELLAEDGPAQFERQSNQITELQEKLKKYEHANAKLDRKVKKLAAQREREAESQNGAAAAEIADLKRQIEEVERATREVQENIQKSKERHQQVMKSLQASLEQKGIATPQQSSLNE